MSAAKELMSAAKELMSVGSSAHKLLLLCIFTHTQHTQHTCSYTHTHTQSINDLDPGRVLRSH